MKRISRVFSKKHTKTLKNFYINKLSLQKSPKVLQLIKFEFHSNSHTDTVTFVYKDGKLAPSKPQLVIPSTQHSADIINMKIKLRALTEQNKKYKKETKVGILSGRSSVVEASFSTELGDVVLSFSATTEPILGRENMSSAQRRKTRASKAFSVFSKGRELNLSTEMIPVSRLAASLSEALNEIDQECEELVHKRRIAQLQQEIARLLASGTQLVHKLLQSLNDSFSAYFKIFTKLFDEANRLTVMAVCTTFQSRVYRFALQQKTFTQTVILFANKVNTLLQKRKNNAYTITRQNKEIKKAFASFSVVNFIKTVKLMQIDFLKENLLQLEGFIDKNVEFSQKGNEILLSKVSILDKFLEQLEEISEELENETMSSCRKLKINSEARNILENDKILDKIKKYEIINKEKKLKDKIEKTYYSLVKGDIEVDYIKEDLLEKMSKIELF